MYEISNKTSKFQTFSPSCYRVLMQLGVLPACLEVFTDAVHPIPHTSGYVYSVSVTYVIKQSYYDLSVAQNREITEIVKI